MAVGAARLICLEHLGLLRPPPVVCHRGDGGDGLVAVRGSLASIITHSKHTLQNRKVCTLHHFSLAYKKRVIQQRDFPC